MKKPQVKADIVCHQNAPAHMTDEIIRDLHKRGRVSDIMTGDPVDVGRAEVTLRVDECRVFTLNLQFRVQLHHRDLNHAIVSLWDEPRGLEIEYCKVVVQEGPRDLVRIRPKRARGSVATTFFTEQPASLRAWVALPPLSEPREFHISTP